MKQLRLRLLVLSVALPIGLAFAAGCKKKEVDAPPVATPGLSVNHERAPAGSPLELTYKFVVAADAPPFTQAYHVMAHVVDTDEEVMWTDDHDPPVPTTAWKPGQTIQYSRTVFVPVLPFVGEATVQLGLYSLVDGKRLPLAGENMGQRAYRAARLQLLPQSENLLTVFKDGWHPAEVPDEKAGVAWQWTKQEAVLAFKNPKTDATLYLDLDSPGKNLHGTQQVQVMLGDFAVDTFALAPDARELRRIKLPAANMGAAEMSEVSLHVQNTFVPATVAGAGNKDPRELGVRVFHIYVDAR